MGRCYAAVLAVAAMLAACSPAPPVNRISWAEAGHQIARGEAILIDVRIPAEAVQPLPGATPIAYVRPGRGGNDETFALEVEMAAGGRRALLACLVGERSAWAAQALARRSIPSASLAGGMAAADFPRPRDPGMRGSKPTTLPIPFRSE